MAMTTWRKLIAQEMENHSETFDDVISCTLSDDELDAEFDDSYGLVEGTPFTLWTHKSVYFPVCYDGSEWASRVSRSPDGKATDHQGGA